MSSEWLGLAELLLVLGGVLGLAVWQRISLRRDRARDRARGDSTRR